MSRFPFLIQCPNPACLNPNNPVGQRLCDRCDTPLIYRYLWAVGPGADQFSPGTLVANRYMVLASRSWLDTQPALPPDAPAELPPGAIAYLELFAQQLHVPVAYGTCPSPQGDAVILLLEHAPLDNRGRLRPSLPSAWAEATPTRQVYWLWQLWQLWQPLKAAGVAQSVLHPDNIRVEGWRVRLLELIADPGSENSAPPTLTDLARVWQRWVAASPLAESLQQVVDQMAEAETSDEARQAIAQSLNQLLLEKAAQMPLRLTLAGGSTAGPQRQHNEDACYPVTVGTPSKHDPLIPNLAIVCDGIGGHAGGEVASQMALRYLELQILALLADGTEQSELTPPEVVQQQLEAVVRVVNNVIAEQNNAQGREARQRMGTTLVLALHYPQTLGTSAGMSNTHELYLVNVGDSRAYWLTDRYCQQLTVDDDVASREAIAGRSIYRAALQRNDAGALTQAIGTREGELLRPTIQRFIIEESGLLLLCSDGLSDGDRIEQNWADLTALVLSGKMTPDDAVQAWLNLANQLNGHDNTSVVLMQCQVKADPIQLFKLDETAPTPDMADWSESSRALLEEEAPAEEAPDLQPVGAAIAPEPPPPEPPRRKSPDTLNLWALTVGTAVLMFVIGAAGIAVWRHLDPIGFDRTVERLVQPSEPTP